LGPEFIHFSRSTVRKQGRGPFRGPRTCYARASVFMLVSMYVAFLDEFGHNGPFLGRDHAHYSQSPVFGLAGYILPQERVRLFATWMFQIKLSLFSREISHYNEHPATWEKKGSGLVTTRNIEKYVEIRRMLFRLINRIISLDGNLFYYGRQKYQKPSESNPGGLYATVLTNSIRRVDWYADLRGKNFMMIMDHHSSRAKLLECAAKTMFDRNQPARRLIEPPFHVENNVYQTVQAADWVAAMVGRLMAYRTRPDAFEDWAWAEKYFGRRLDCSVVNSTLWRPPPNLLGGSLG